MPQLLTIPATVHGRALMVVPSESATLAATAATAVLVGFHGYAENAERHLQELLAIPGVDSWVRVAVQGLHPFYNTKTGEVVASWMTKEDRELAIADNVAYVRSLVERVRAETGAAGPLVYAGFSQGVAMAYRAAALSGHGVAGVIALGGDLPPELGEPGSVLKSAGLTWRVLIGRGESDPWYTAEKLALDLEALARHGVAARATVYTGGHEWTEAFREAAGRFLVEITSLSEQGVRLSVER